MKPYILYRNIDGSLIEEIDASSEDEALGLFKSKYSLLKRHEWNAFDHFSLATADKSHFVMNRDVFIHYLMRACNKPLFK